MADETSTTEAGADPTPAPACRMVAIGSSAGGLEALKTLFNHLPADLGVAFAVITHLDPHHPSELAPILSRYTRMPVAAVTEALPIDANHVYVAPNRQHGPRLGIAGRFDIVTGRRRPRGARLAPDIHAWRILEQPACRPARRMQPG